MFEGSHADNHRDKVQKGRQWHPAGTRNGRARLSAADVRRIRERAEAGETYPAIAASLGVARSTVADAVNGRTWRTA